MGAKAGILALGDGDFAESLRQLPAADAAGTDALVADVFPGYQVEPVRGWPLAEATYPPDDEVQALSAASIGIVCDGRFVLDRPSELPDHVLDLAAGRRVVLYAVHSVDDSFAYGAWNDGVLLRSLSVSLPLGIVEDAGERLEFEQPFWATRNRLADRHPDSLGFHPLDLAEQALRWLFGFSLEGAPEPGDVDAGQISMLGYRVTDPTGAEQAAREAAVADFMDVHRRRTCRPSAS